MRVKLLTLQYSPLLGGIDDRPLADFVRDKQVLAVREHFFTVHDLPHLLCLVSYQEARLEANGRAASAPADARAGKPSRQHPAASLSDVDRALFQALREWRSTRARKEGVPAYVLFTDRELIAIIRARPTSPTALLHVDGVGPAKVERYGQEVLRLLGAEATGPAATDANGAGPRATDANDATSPAAP